MAKSPKKKVANIEKGGLHPRTKANRHRMPPTGLRPFRYPKTDTPLTRDQKSVFLEKHNLAVYEAMLQAYGSN